MVTRQTVVIISQHIQRVKISWCVLYAFVYNLSKKIKNTLSTIEFRMEFPGFLLLFYFLSFQPAGLHVHLSFTSKEEETSKACCWLAC